MRLAWPRDEARLFASAAGAVLLAPLPDDRFLLIMDAPPSGDDAPLPVLEFLSREAGRRIGADAGLHGLQWVSRFAMHKRIVSKMAGKNWFLLGDAAHLSSVFGGEGLNAGLMDAADLAWKLALSLRGAGHPILLDSYEIERRMADERALMVSDQIHQNLWKLVKAFGSGAPVEPTPVDSEADRAFQRMRCMLDVSYAGSPLTGERRGLDSPWPSGPLPGDRYPDRSRLSGTTHHLVVFGRKDEAPENFAARWRGLAEVVYGPDLGLLPSRAGVPAGGAILVRPDGFIGFRVDLADVACLSSVEDHLSTYLRR
jgi:hypothetical protein